VKPSRLRQKLALLKRVEVVAYRNEGTQDFGSVVAILHVTDDDRFKLCEYEIQGPPCAHVTNSQEDLDEIDKLIAQMKRVAKQLHIELKIDGDGISKLLHRDKP
jgi:hypothetical protein